MKCKTCQGDGKVRKGRRFNAKKITCGDCGGSGQVPDPNNLQATC